MPPLPENHPMIQQVLNPNPLHSNLLHVKPVSHQIFRGINFIGTSLQNANPNELSGRFRNGLGKAVIITGYVLNTAIALVESIVALLFASIMTGIHAATKARSVHFQKITLKVDAYLVNTTLIVAAQILCLKKRIFSKYHTLNAATNHGIQAGSALLSQFIGLQFDRLANRRAQPGQLEPAVERSFRLVLDIAPTIIRDVLRGIARDFAVRNNPQHPNIQQFLLENPNHANILNRFDFQLIRRDAVYRQQFLGMAGNFLAQAGLFNNMNGNLRIIPQRLPAPQAPGQVNAVNPVNVYGVNHNEEDRRYQENLETLIKRSFVEIHDSEDLVRMLSKNNDVDDGRLELTTYSTTIQLANYVQYKEIKADINCPEAFRAQELHEFNNRNQRIVDAKRRMEQLTEEEHALLVQKLLKTADFDLKAQGLTEERSQLIQQLFNDIGTLAGQLHQGKLLAQKYVNLGELNLGNFNGAYGANNLFNGACQEAAKEIEDRQPQNPK